MSERWSEERPATVLVVDDDAAVRRLAARCLGSLGVRTVPADSAAAAEGELERQVPDLIVLDIVMPEVSGLELCRRLRLRDDTRDTPVLMMTGAKDPGALERAYEAGATDFVAKPFTPVMLRHRVRYLLRSGNAFRQLHESQARLAAAQRIAQLGTWELDAAEGTLSWCDELFHIFGMQRRERVDVDEMLARVHPEDAGRVKSFLGQAAAGRQPEPVQYRVMLEDGVARHIYQQVQVDKDPVDGSLRVLGTAQDVTRRTEDQAKIRFLAYRDVLTGLPNRRLLTDRLDRAIGSAQRSGLRTAVLHVDVDRFKAINEGYGHHVGDELLREIAARLARCLRITDTVARDAPDRPTLSRLGGDEFIVVLHELEGESEPTQVAARVLSELGHPYSVGDTEILISASIGVAVYPEDGVDGKALIRRAETALAHAKSQGGNSFLFYNAQMNTNAAARLELASRLHRGLEQKEFWLAYQPIFDTDSREVRGVEALLRWTDPERGEIGPVEFIPVAEETGLILPLGDWVIDEACGQWRARLDEGVGPLEVSVNVAARQFRDPDLIVRVAQSIRRHGVDPAYLRFELTEGTLMSSSALTADLVSEIQRLGIGLAVDDFGTGYSSLGYLRRFPAEVLKIDRSFVQGIPENQESCSLVAAIVAMAHKLRMRVVAEGVETEAQLRFLRARLRGSPGLPAGSAGTERRTGGLAARTPLPGRRNAGLALPQAHGLLAGC